MGKSLEKIVDFAVRVSTKGVMNIAAYVGSIAASVYSKAYSGPYEQLVHGYGHDISLPFGTYFILQSLISVPNNKLPIAASVFTTCSVGEAAQAVGLLSGKFDPWDFLAYAAGTGLALGFDVIIERTTKRKRAAALDYPPERDAKPQAITA